MEKAQYGAMNKTMDSIMTRRTVRAFAPEQISDERLAEIIKAGEYAASARGLQSRHLTVIQNKEVIDKITAKGKEELRKSTDPFYIERVNKPDFSIFYGAPTVIIASADETRPLSATDCACSIHNMAVAAASMDICSCIIAMVIHAFRGENGPELIKELGIPAGFIPSLTIALGYVRKGFEVPERAPRRGGMVKFIK